MNRLSVLGALLLLAACEPQTQSIAICPPPPPPPPALVKVCASYQQFKGFVPVANWLFTKKGVTDPAWVNVRDGLLDLCGGAK